MKLLAGRSELFKASEVRELLKLTEGRKIISLAGGLPDPQTFPKEELAEIAQEVISERGESSLQYAPTAGVTEFRKELTDFLQRKDVKVNSSDSILITTGSQQALDLISRVFIEREDVIIVELPTYLAALNAYTLSHPQIIGVPVDGDGMRVDLLERELKKVYARGKNVKFIYTIPVAHNPAGVTMSVERKKALLQLASEYDVVIIEDDPYSYFVYESGVDVTPLKTLDKEGRVIYLGTLSKILSPGLRLGWVLGDHYVIDVLERAKQTTDLHTSSLTQYIALEALRRGVIEKTIERAKQVYKVKRDVMLDSLLDYMPENTWWPKPVGGLFVMVFLPSLEIDTRKLLTEAIAMGVAYVPGASFFANGGGWNSMRLNFSFPSPDKIAEGVKILGGLARDKIKTPSKPITPESFYGM
ncbi:MAG: PLP-dependent aminotransferase family protein [Zestosphaera sp.]